VGYDRPVGLKEIDKRIEQLSDIQKSKKLNTDENNILGEVINALNQLYHYVETWNPDYEDEDFMNSVEFNPDSKEGEGDEFNKNKIS